MSDCINKSSYEKTSESVRRKVTSYRVRKGSISPTARDRFNQLWPLYGQDLAQLPGTFAETFSGDQPLVLDIGPGTGVSTIAMAAQEPQLLVLAVEVYTPGLVKIVSAIAEKQLHNVKVINGDAVEVLQNFIPPGRLTGIRVFFPDPWPKKRHHKRRLLSIENLCLMSQALASHGLIHIATDHAGYAEYITENIAQVASLRSVEYESVIAGTDVSSMRMSVDRPCTKFEARGLALGHEIKDFFLAKN